MKVLILHKNESRACKLAATIQADLRARDVEAVVVENHQPALRDLQDYTLIIVLGGDGTILETARLLTGSDIPLLGINFGKIGFLSSIEPDDWPLALEKLMQHQYSLEKRMMIEAQINRDGQGLHLGRALNDVVIRSQVLHIMTLKLSVDGRPYAVYRSDGVICATPTGSTAYSYSAGGPVLAADLEAMVVTPVCPQLSCARSLVIKADAQLELTIDCDCGAGIALDGEKEMDLIKGDRISIRRSKETVSFVQINPVSSMKKIVRCRNRIS
ncbi:MAG TPA: NAD(+)/NADH kinase [Syntrophomonadaceae bacterium]|nr:NAD(+)/NADH kinase [Syntrophomonadaceae bacterium]